MNNILTNYDFQINKANKWLEMKQLLMMVH